jgi:hypothetical protein
VRELAATAKLKPLLIPTAASGPEPGYRPSTALAEFVRARDLTCRFPGCDKPAQVCDIDHTIPYGAGGPTHAANLKLLCRFHHLLKTFYSAWSDRQLPDGTVIWTAPNGQTYTTTPGGSFFFPILASPTPTLTAPTTLATPTTNRGPSPASGRCPQMPTRSRTRAQDRRWPPPTNPRPSDSHLLSGTLFRDCTTALTLARSFANGSDLVDNLREKDPAVHFDQ